MALSHIQQDPVPLG